MIIVRIVGGLGNQMFLYAYAKSLESKGYQVKIDISAFKKYKLHGGYQLDKYQIDLAPANSFSRTFAKLNSVKEKSLLFDSKLFELKGNEYVKGYFQTEKYFSEIRESILEQFTIKPELSQTTKEITEKINASENSCSVHIRRGDYISNEKAKSVHGICSLDYYREAIELMNEKHKNLDFYVFSDDIEWTKENLDLNNAYFVDHKCIPHEDIYLMSLCKNNITANSSFSWWGAWLNNHKNKTVISPKQWFVTKENEVACENWIKL